MPWLSRANAPTANAHAHLVSVRLIYDSILGSVDRANEWGTQLVTLERDAGSVRGLARALRFSCYSDRMLGEFGRALASASEALELAERHKLVGEAASAADVFVSVHLHTET